MTARPRPRLLCAVAWPLAASLLLSACAAPQSPRNAILIVLDTLRADGLSAYGNPRETTPVLDELARRGVLFESAVSNASTTLPAMAGLLSGRYPTAQVFDRGLRVSLVENLRDAGWNTAAFVEGGFVSEMFGLNRGFEHFREQAGGVARIEGIEQTFRRARAWLEENGDRPFFLLIHTYEPHVPYRRRTYAEGLEGGRFGPTLELPEAMAALDPTVPVTPQELAFVRALYDGGARASDEQVGGLLASLAELELADETLVVVTSDHGEDLGDRLPVRLASHGHALYDEQLLVPLVLYDPTREFPVRRVTAQVRSVDVMPTILDLLGAPAIAGRYGRSLLPLMTGEESADRLAWAEVPRHPFRPAKLRFAARTGKHKVILTPGAPDGSRRRKVELYDLEADPHERVNLAAAERRLTRALLRRLKQREAELRTEGPPVYLRVRPLPDPSGEERLRELGYLVDPPDSGPGAPGSAGPDS